jgi:lipoprotein NlpD
MTRLFILSFLIFSLTACESNPPAPVIERAPQASKPKPPDAKSTETKPLDQKNVGNTAGNKDWRPDSHIVVKGDTMFGIGLEYGLDYKEIAAANNIPPPYPIKIGQKIDLSSFKTKAVAGTESGKTEDGVVITPMKTESVVTEAKPIQEANKPVQPAVTPVLNEPKAVREPYSLEALNRAPIKSADIKETKPAEIKASEAKPTDTKSSDANASDDESITWAWPTQGKVVAGFNEASNKGIDITGTTGQAINAASAGKVIYTGSDLRGYGKLVIIKHNKTYLSVYAHNSKIVVKEGQSVTTGQKIAEMGNTDSSTVKLHFEIRRLGKSIDPAKYLNQN